MISIVVARARHNVIGRNGGIPWPRIAEDMAHFRRLTSGGVVIMGRKTWDSLPAKHRPLPYRTNVVLSRSDRFPMTPMDDGSVALRSLESAMYSFRPSVCSVSVFLIGGADVYRQALESNLVDRMYLTEIDLDVGREPGDATFDFDPSGWTEANRRVGKDPQLTFVTLERRSA